MTDEVTTARVELQSRVLSTLDPAPLRLGAWRLRRGAWSGLGLVLEGVEDESGVAGPDDYVNAILMADEQRDAFFELIDREGLVVCKNVGGDDAAYEDVRGRSSRGRLSQGEYYHHDGCTGPVKPRVVEIRCPRQEVARHTHTAIARFPETVYAMLLELPAALRQDGELAAHHAAVAAGEAIAADAWDQVQGLVIRKARRALSAEEARAYLRAVDVRAGAYREPWTMGESRFIANANAGRTLQHRRAYLEAPGTRANGKLVKRWPGHVYEASADSDEPMFCARDGDS